MLFTISFLIIRGFSREATPPTFPASATLAPFLDANLSISSFAVTTTAMATTVATAMTTAVATTTGTSSAIENQCSPKWRAVDDGPMDDGILEDAPLCRNGPEDDDADELPGDDIGHSKWQIETDDKGIERNNSGTSQSSIDSGIGDTAICAA